MKKLNNILMAITLLLIMTSHASTKAETTQFTKKTITIVKQELPVFGSLPSLRHSNSMKLYFAHYGINSIKAKHYFGTFNWKTSKIAAHLFKPAKCSGTVFILHGYLNHGALLRHPINHFIQKGYAVAIFDLQGHGFSDGKRADIKDFSHYSSALDLFIKKCSNLSPEPFYGVGHSTGCSVFLDYLRKGRNPFRKLIFAAPLIRSNSWHLSRFGHTIASPFVSTIPRLFKKTSSDAEFLDFLEHKDFLQARRIPLSWVDALFRWNRTIQEIPVNTADIAIIQGTEDRVVDWKHNLVFLKEKFPNSDVLIIPEARHELFNESQSIRNRIFSFIDKHIQ